MPLYAFECAHCGHSFDRLQRLSDPDPSDCPACGQPGIRRQLTAPSFRLAGAGWYETDFKKDGDKKRNLADAGGSSAEPAAKTEAKPEAKPAAKPEPAAKPVESKPAASS
jgi:putative FmdB family regulatory protein